MDRDNQNTRTPYTKIAPIYDMVMSHVNYKTWARYIRSFYTMRGSKVKSIIDLACGTGSLLEKLTDKRRQYYGSDLSIAMLHVAHSKKKLKRVPFIAADFRSLPYKSDQFDLALNLYDSINYLIEDEQVEEAFNEIHRILKKGGLFIFDVVTPYVCRREFSPYHEVDYAGNTGFERNSWFDENEQMQYNLFDIMLDEEKYREIHKQKIRPVLNWQDLLAASPFKVLQILGDFSYHQYKETAERVHFICKKVTHD
ncbi:MAG: methyltransferase domain-containing protein [Caldithrix sp.]|nr:methyltransferase domain-containing protein [Caldithrix sp.]